MAKIDIKAAYRMVPVHPQDRHLFGMMWEDKVYVDAALPFGLRSAPKIFTAVADTLEWIATTSLVEKQCRLNMELLVDLCHHLGVPLAEEKVEVPSTSLVFLGIIIDSVAGELRLPLEKTEQVACSDSRVAW